MKLTVFASGSSGNCLLLSGGGVNYWHKIISTELDRVTEGTRVRPMPEEKEVKTFYATEPFKFFVYTELENEENEILFYGQMVK